MSEAESGQERILVLAPTGRDNLATATVLRKTALLAVTCGDLSAFVSELSVGVGVALVAEEALLGQALDELVAWIDRQPPWSDLPFLMLTSHREAPSIARSRRLIIEQLRNVSLIERPLQPITLVSAVRASLRARRHQYRVRGHILARHQAEEELERLVSERTRALETANEQLRTEMIERERMQEVLSQSQKLEAIGQLTGGVAHDFNNLLTIIRSSIEFLRKPDLPEARRQRYTEMIGETVDRAAKLTSQLLAFARRSPLQVETFNAAEKTRRMVDVLTTIVGAGIEIRTEVSCDPCWVRADLNQFETALVNLVVNARDAMPEGGRLTVALHAVSALPALRTHKSVESRFAAVSVIDTGEGIPSDKIGRIFEPFFTTKGVGKGTGLGLSQVFGFAKQSGGDVDVNSEPGYGATFTLYLPSVVPDASAPPDPSPESSDRTLPGCVLVVEDNQQVREAAVQLLQDLGYTTAWAADATSALKLVENDPDRFDVIFSDVVMPGPMDGMDLLRAVKQRVPGLPVILATGYSDALAQGGNEAFELLRKPYSIEALSQLIRKVQRRRLAPELS
jgi:signal transduction histidine kinase/CheY-like chemotaxis protein